MFYPVVSNTYEVALLITKGMLKAGLITKDEFDKIDQKNRESFITEKPINNLL